MSGVPELATTIWTFLANGREESLAKLAASRNSKLPKGFWVAGGAEVVVFAGAPSFVVFWLELWENRKKPMVAAAAMPIIKITGVNPFWAVI